jgi:ABC-type Zn2+ transport system substrate-binding protein/surface adhesin
MSKAKKLEGAVLFVRVGKDLKRALEQRLAAQRTANPGVTLSMSDMVRSMLWNIIQAEQERRASM